MRNPRCSVVFLVCWSILAVAHGQSVAHGQAGDQPEAQSHQPSDETTAETHDSLGRDTPNGTVLGFLQIAQSGKYREAAQYLRLSRGERITKGESLARQLHALMDSAFVGRVGSISHRREGSVEDGVPQDHERIGVFRINGAEADVDLVRITDPAAGEIWLFSSQTLAEVPRLFSQIESSNLESRLPGFLATKRVFSTPLWRWIAFFLLIPISFGLAWGMVRLLRAGLRAWLRWRPHPVLKDVQESFAGPATLILTVVFHQIGVYFLGVPLLIWVYYQRITGLVLVGCVAWLVFRFINHWGERARVMAMAGSGYQSGSLVLLGQRIVKVMVVIIALLVMLSVIGVDITTAVAGLGIGSLAIAFAAQKTLENLFGGISILGDQVIRVGETCQIGDHEGTVEDISLRSTRIRTLDRTELSVPNGQLANMNVENISRRDKSLFRTKLELQQEASPDQLRSLLTEMRALLRDHAKVEAEGMRVRFIGFGESSLDVQIHCHILTSSLDEFLAIREELLLRIMDLVAGTGIGFAMPSRALYLTEDQESNPPATAIKKKPALVPPLPDTG